MVNQLKDLPSDKFKRAIILNGKLVTANGHKVVTYRKRYYRVFEEVLPGGKSKEIDGVPLLEDIALKFNDRYSMFATGMKREELWDFPSKIDGYTNALILQNPLYDLLRDKSGEKHWHDSTRRFEQNIEAMIKLFDIELIEHYLEIYIHLFNSRLQAGYSPMKIRGSLVAGLFQPIVIATPAIECPLHLPELSWFLSYLQYPYAIEQSLTEEETEYLNGLVLTMASMADISERFNTECIRELDKLHFLCIMYTILATTIDGAGYEYMQKRYSGIWGSIQSGSNGNKQTAQFAGEFMQGVIAASQQLSVV